MLQSAGACATRAVCICQLLRPGLLLWCIRGAGPPNRPPRKLNEPSRRIAWRLRHAGHSSTAPPPGMFTRLGGASAWVDVVAGKTFGVNTEHSGLRKMPRWASGLPNKGMVKDVRPAVTGLWWQSLVSAAPSGRHPTRKTRDRRRRTSLQGSHLRRSFGVVPPAAHCVIRAALPTAMASSTAPVLL